MRHCRMFQHVDIPFPWFNVGSSVDMIVVIGLVMLHQESAVRSYCLHLGHGRRTTAM